MQNEDALPQAQQAVCGAERDLIVVNLVARVLLLFLFFSEQDGFLSKSGIEVGMLSLAHPRREGPDC